MGIIGERSADFEQSGQSKILNALSWAYDKALNPAVPGIYSAYDLAEDHCRNRLNAHEGTESLMRWLNAKTATSAYLCGLCGLMTLPSAIPANISSVLFVQIRLITAMALIGGYDAKNDKVRALIYASLCGDATEEILKDAGVRLGRETSMAVINNLSAQVLANINRKVGYRLIAAFDEKGLINLGKSVPFVGEIVAETYEAVASPSVFNVARNIFIGMNGQADRFRNYSKAS